MEDRQAPLYWQRDDGDNTGWRVFTLKGWAGLSALLDVPVCHIGFFEAEAFARWRGCRLPTEAEWECVARESPMQGNPLDTGRLHPAKARGAVSSTSSWTAGNGRPLLTSAIRDTSLFPERWANITASLCPARWFCAAAPASPPRIISAQRIETVCNQKPGGSSPAYVWHFRRDSSK